jgi:tetratricopeptide (TPR) repeat protein
MPEETPQLVGTTLSHYRLLEEIGKGGMGTVYLAEVLEPWSDLRPGDQVAVKVVHPHLLTTMEAVERFRREARLGLRLDHPNVVRTLDIREEAGPSFPVHFLVTEYVRGQTLRDLIGELGIIGEEMVLHIARQAVGALAAVHAAGIIHRDVKPENLLITEDNVVRLMDLGVARPLWQTTRLSRTGQFVGSVLYAAPEQFRSPEKVDGRADLYALGLVLYGLLTGEHPFDRTDIGVVIEHHIRLRPRSPSELNSSVSPFLEAVVMTLLSKDPDDRFADAEELVTVLSEREESSWWTSRAGRRLAAPAARHVSLSVDRTTPLVARDDDLARLRRAADTVVSGRGQAMLVRGEAGMGKSRLIDDFLRDLVRSDSPLLPLVAGAAADPLGGSCGLFREALVSGLASGGGARTVAADFPASFSGRATCAEFLEGRPVGKGEGAIPPEALPGVLKEIIGSLAERSPLLLVLEDIHDADEICLALVPLLARALHDSPVLMVLTMRPAPPDSPVANALLQMTEETRLETLDLDPLTRGDVESMLSHTVDTDMARRLAPMLMPAAEGNPRHVLEILHELRETRRIVPGEDGAWTVAGSLDRIAMPSSVRERIRGRVAALDESERAIVEILALVGGAGDAELLAAVLEREVLGVLRDLGRLERLHALVRSSRGSFALRHERIGEVIAEEMAPALARNIHERVAGVLEADCPDPDVAPPERALLLARHLAAAGRWERALPFLPPALEHLDGLQRFGEVLELTRPALDAIADGVRCDEDTPVRIGLARARALRFSGRLEDERRQLETLAHSVAGAIRGHVAVELAWSFYRAGDLERATQSALQGHRDAVTWGESGIECDALRCLGAIAFAGGRLTDASGHLVDALTLAKRSHDRRNEAATLRTLGMVRAGYRDLDRARCDLQRALELSRRLEDRRGVAACLGNLALILREAGEGERAREEQLAALAMFREIGDRRGEARTLGNLALDEEALGMREEALKHHRQAARRLENLGDRRGLAVTRTNLGLLLEAMGRYDDAAEELRLALAVAREIRDDDLVASVLGALAAALRAQGELGPALEALVNAITIHESLADWRGAAFARANLACVLANAGSLEEAAGQLQAAQQYAMDVEDRDLAHAVAESELCASFSAGDFEGVLRASSVLSEPVGLPTRSELRRELMIGLAQLKLGHDEAPLTLDRVLGGANESTDRAVVVLGRLGLVLTGRADPGALKPLRDEVRTLEVRDQLLAFWLGCRVRQARGDTDAARPLLEAAYFLMHRVQASLPEDMRNGYVEEAYPQREILRAWESAGIVLNS